MATGNSSISSQLSHGGCVGDEGRLTRSPPGPRTLRERVHDSTQHAVHDTCDGVQSDSQSTVYRQCEASNFKQEGDVGVERGLAAVSWRADATNTRIHSIIQSFNHSFEYHIAVICCYFQYCHLLLLSRKADTHFNIRRRVEG